MRLLLIQAPRFGKPLLFEIRPGLLAPQSCPAGRETADWVALGGMRHKEFAHHFGRHGGTSLDGDIEGRMDEAAAGAGDERPPPWPCRQPGSASGLGTD